MKTRIDETNHMRKLMGLSILNEQENTTSSDDFDKAVNFCKELEKWWEGSGNWFFNPEEESGAPTEYVNFFKRFQGTNDDEDSAALAYEHMIKDKLNNSLDKSNKYYSQILGWVDKVVDEINDLFQNPVKLTLLGPNGRTEYFVVDPEIDV